MDKKISYVESKYETYQEMSDYANGWSHLCNYQLSSTATSGYYKILELPHMQLAFTDNLGGIMYNFDPPKDTICISIMQLIDGKACLDSMKLETGNIIFFDDSKRYTFMSNSRVKLLDISIKKSTTSILYQRLINAVKMYILDTNHVMQNLISNMIENYSELEKLNHEIALELEMQITNTMLSLLEKQKPREKYLTKGERKAAIIRDKTFLYMDANINVESLSKQYEISPKTLQTGFKSLFGLTPIKFLRLLKLNLVRGELLQESPQTNRVMQIALKWGFNHMGRFCAYYKELFLELPSETLKGLDTFEGINENCILKEEEI